ncbi:MAG: hypothetical protein WBO36_06015, partial [Saprospiraceae bacterium]
MNQRKQYIALFLACITYGAALGFIPKLDISTHSASSVLIKKDISCQMTTVIKNDLSLLSGGTAIAVKKNVQTIGQFVIINRFLSNKLFSAPFLNRFIITSCLKDGLKTMIYPFHT